MSTNSHIDPAEEIDWGDGCGDSLTSGRPAIQQGGGGSTPFSPLQFKPGRMLLKDGAEIVGASDGDIWFREVEKTVADKIIVAHHYSKKATKNTFCSLLINSGEGAIQLGYGIRPKNKGELRELLGEENWCEFDRMWLSDSMPRFSESRVIGLLFFYLKHRWPKIEFVITYADESAGNKGIIYQATNATELEGKKVDFYLLPSGERVHPVTMWHRHKTRAFAAMQALYPGIIHVCGDNPKGATPERAIALKGLRQRKYIYAIGKSAKRRLAAFVQNP